MIKCPMCGSKMNLCGKVGKRKLEQYLCEECDSILISSNVKNKYIYTRDEFERFYLEAIEERLALEKKIADECLLNEKKEKQIQGYCDVCKKEVDFHLDFMYSDGVTPNYRERLVCPSCGLNNRQRFIVARIKNQYVSNQKIYMYEQITSVYVTVKSFAEDLVGSEYVDSKYKSGEIINGILHQDAENLSFEDEKFDLIVSNDVFEHVTDVEKCLKEASRVLKNGGKLMLSVPFYTNYDKTQRRAKIENGNLVNLKQPLYHGNPMSQEGSLVFFDFGWDLLIKLKENGFRDAYMIPYYDENKGYLGGIPFIFEAVK